jgi:hypothetical protein
MREVPLIHMPSNLGLATAHLPQSSSALRFTGKNGSSFLNTKDSTYSSSAPNTFPVLGWTIWTCGQARQANALICVAVI